jgi:hypothetical protein
MPASIIEREFYPASPETYCSGHDKRSNTPGVLKALFRGRPSKPQMRRTKYDQPRYRRRVGPLSGGGAKVMS